MGDFFALASGIVPCRGYRSTQLIKWNNKDDKGPESHLCNGIIDCIDRSDESDCKDPQGSSEVNEGINMKVIHCKPPIRGRSFIHFRGCL